MKLVNITLAATLALGGAAWAQQKADEHSGHHAPAAAAPGANDEMTDGEVRKIDAEAGKITLKHGDIKNLDMPGMTMVFAVKDKAMLGNLKAGDKVKFKVVSDSGKLTITELQAAQ
jgi:Cu/Ag efflux protein CusF